MRVRDLGYVTGLLARCSCPHPGCLPSVSLLLYNHPLSPRDIVPEGVGLIVQKHSCTPKEGRRTSRPREQLQLLPGASSHVVTISLLLPAGHLFLSFALVVCKHFLRESEVL